MRKEGTRWLARAFFPPTVELPDGTQLSIFNNACGTIEFRVRSDWRGAWYQPVNRFEPLPLRHTFVDFSASQHIWYHRGPVIIEHVDRRGHIIFSSSKVYKNTGVSASADIGQRDVWSRQTWHHLACVWDEGAKDDDRMRIYLDGRRVSGGAGVHNREQWTAEEPLMDADAPFVTQIGCRNTGRWPMRALLRDLRISRTARYTEDFNLPVMLDLDTDTTAFWSFDGTLSGVGMMPGGEKYQLQATAGVVTQR